MHYYKFNIADWHLGTSHLSLEEEAAYLRLINYYYDTEEPIPLETDRVFRRLRLGKGSDVGLSVLDEFFTKTKDGWIHERCDREIDSYQEKADANRENGKKGGRPRKIKGLDDNPEKPSGFILGTQEKPTDNLNQEPLTKNQEPPTKEPQKNKFSDDDMRCAEWISGKLKEFIPDCRKPNLNSWADHIRKMREIDNRSHKEIGQLWLWCRRDSFEAANVQSPAKLRERYDQLKIKMLSAAGVKPTPAKVDYTPEDYNRGINEDGTF